jgi:L-amino acid N-acyltransferase YncA
MSAMRTRRATAKDAPDVARLYARGVWERSVIDGTIRDEAEIAAWIALRHPFAVAIDESEIVAFAMMLPARNLETAARVGDLVVHVASARRRQGAGRLAVAEVIAQARASGIWKLMAYALADNTEARAFFGALDFRAVGVLEKHVQTDSLWRDVVIFERLLLASRRSSSAVEV